jgi:hypothetical protein
MGPWSIFQNRDGILRKGFLNVALKVAASDGKILYQRRISVEVTRKRGQASATAMIAAIAIAQFSPITINPEAVHAKEEKTVASDVLADLFAKFQDELVADQDLIDAIRNKPIAAKLKNDPIL